MKRLNIFLILIVLSIPMGKAQETPETFQQKMEEFAQAVLKKFPNVPGFSMAIIQDSEVLLKKGFGWADQENKALASAQSNYYIASSTKSFTALLALILDQEGVLSLDQSFAQSFPEISFPDSLEAEKVQLRHLLNHTSGLNNSGIGFRVAYTGQHDQHLLNELVAYTTANRVGRDNFQYSNIGYNLYTLILENKTHKAWQDWLAEKIFQPLGMKNTSAYMSKAEKENWELAKPYISYQVGRSEEAYLMKKDNTMQSAGGMITTAADLALWLEVQLNEGRLKGKQIFPAELIKNSHRKTASQEGRKGDIFEDHGYGMGWEIGTYGKHEVIHHFGGFPGFLTHISFLPESNLGVVVMVNEGMSGYRVMNLLAEYAYDFLLGPRSKNFQEEKDKQLEKLAKENQKRLESIHKNLKERAQRTWQLQHPFAEYAGVYEHNLYGKVKIEAKNQGLWISLGNLHCQASPYPKAETARVELVPGSGEVLLFQWEANTLKGLLSDGDFFKKID